MIRKSGGRRRMVVAWVFTSALIGCGGGGGEAVPSMQPSAAHQLHARALASAASASTPFAGADTLFDWAERQYPHLFQNGTPTQKVIAADRGYTFRYYASNGNYLGLSNGGTVFALGPVSEGQLQNLGSFEPYLCLASPGTCSEPPARIVRVAVLAGSLQCVPGSGNSRIEVRRRLTDGGVRVAGSDCVFGDYGVPASCESHDARHWAFDIDEADLALAEAIARAESLDLFLLPSTYATRQGGCDY